MIRKFLIGRFVPYFSAIFLTTEAGVTRSSDPAMARTGLIIFDASIFIVFLNQETSRQFPTSPVLIHNRAYRKALFSAQQVFCSEWNRRPHQKWDERLSPDGKLTHRSPGTFDDRPFEHGYSGGAAGQRRTRALANPLLPRI